MPVSAFQDLELEAFELGQQRDAIVATAEARATSGKPRGLTPAERAETARINARVTAIDAELAAERARRAAARVSDGQAASDVATSIGPAPVASGAEHRLASLQAKAGRSGRTYVELFGKPKAAASEGWSSFDEFLGVIHNRQSDSRVVAATSMGATIGGDGGFLVPEQYSAELLDASLESEIVRPGARVYPMTSETRKIAGFDGGDHSASLFGFMGVWLAENATATPQKGKTRLMTLNAHKLAIFANASNELVADGMTFEELLGEAMRQAVGFDVDQACLTGTGAGKPRGILADPALITVTKETGQPADTILVENLDKMFARMHPAGRQNAVWIANSTAIPQLLSLVRTAGTGGTPVPVMTERDGGFSILTRPVLFTEKVPVLGDAGDISFVDRSQYAIGLRKEAVIDRSNAPGWFEDESSYRTIIRIDGQGRWAKPLTPRNGDTLSWAVTLGARA